MTRKIGYILLGDTDRMLASTRITILNTLEKIKENGYDPVILDKSKKYNPDRNLDGIVSKAVEHGLGRGDIVYFQSMRSPSAVSAAREFKSKGIRTIFGICNFIAPEMADECDITIVPSQSLKENYPIELQKKIKIVHDGIEFPDIEKVSYDSQKDSCVHAVFLTGKRYEYIRGMWLPDNVDLTVIGAYGHTKIESFRVPKDQGFKKGVEGLREFAREKWSLDAYKRITDFDIGVAPVDLSEPMARSDMAPTNTRSSNKLTQMMNAGLPVIAGPLDAYLDIITHGVDGFIAQTKEDWFDAFDELNDPETRKRVGKAARERVKDEFSLDAQVEKLIAIFDSLTEIPFYDMMDNEIFQDYV